MRVLIPSPARRVAPWPASRRSRFWLLQNKLRVLIAACDTFRSGAVEQLRVHVRNLRGAYATARPGCPGPAPGLIRSGQARAGVRTASACSVGRRRDRQCQRHGRHGGAVRKGLRQGRRRQCPRRHRLRYVMGAAAAAGRWTDAVELAHTTARWRTRRAGKANKFDVVMIDTAGRMQDNAPLMRALAKVRRRRGTHGVGKSLSGKRDSPRVRSVVCAVRTPLGHP